MSKTVFILRLHPYPTRDEAGQNVHVGQLLKDRTSRLVVLSSFCFVFYFCFVGCHEYPLIGYPDTFDVTQTPGCMQGKRERRLMRNTK